ncbi:MAG: hypothetical protein ABJA80_08165 [bacterium]
MVIRAAVVHVAPTLASMASLHELSRDGGPRSPRFEAYRARVEHEWGLIAYNPMAGPAALTAIRTLIDIDAEGLMAHEARVVAQRCAYEGTLTLAVAVASKGMWTDRLATALLARTTGGRRAAHGAVLLWADEPADAEIVRRESVAETVRTMWSTLHGAATSLGGVLAREGLAYAMGSSPHAPSTPDDDAVVESAIGLLGDTDDAGDIAGVLFGDPTSVAMGWMPLGIPEHAGYRWAIARAAESITQYGAPAALRTARLPDSGPGMRT